MLDKLNTAIKAYLISLDPEALTEADHRRANAILSFTTNLEHAGDVVDKNLLGIVSKQLKRGLVFSAEGQAELLRITDRLVSNGVWHTFDDPGRMGRMGPFRSRTTLRA